jgi:integrase
MPRRPSIPTYRLHRQSNQAIVTFRLSDGRRRDVLLGPHGSPESRAEYARLLAEWEAARRADPPQTRPLPDPHAPRDLTVNELLLRFWRHAEAHYGTGSGELAEYRRSLRPVKDLYGHLPAARFGPLALKAVREGMIREGLARGPVNQRVGRIKRAFRWAVSEELVPASVYEALRAVPGLQKGRSAARETAPVTPVADAVVDRTLPHLPVQVRAIVRVLRLTGMRPSELCAMRPEEVERDGAVRLYRLSRHKTSHRGKERVVAIGPRAWAVLEPFVAACPPGAFVFSPARAREERYRLMRERRRTPVQPSQVSRKKLGPRRVPGERYSPVALAHAVARACKAAGIPNWHVYQLRHAHATEVRRRYGLEAAQVSLGHSHAAVTQVYAERDLTLAARVAAEIG